MFQLTVRFNCDIGAWDTSSVSNMAGIFKDSKSFNQDLRRWDTSRVILMKNAFVGAEAFDPDNAPPAAHTPEFEDAW